MRRRHPSLRALVILLGAVAAATGLAGCGPEEPPAAPTAAEVRTGRDPQAPRDLAATDLGIHSFTTRPETPTGSIRLNCSPGWSTVEPAPGEFDWTDFDRTVERAEEWGYRDILYVFCATPSWAGQAQATPDEGAFGPGTARPPARMSDFADFVRAVVQRYRGRITGYEVWNEPGSPQFFTGTGEQMAEMTAVVARTVAAEDPDAAVVTAGFQTGDPALMTDFVPRYFAGLRQLGWPVDAVSAHFYTASDAGPQQRIAQIDMVRRLLDRYGAPADLPLWDTEVNYAVDRPGGMPAGRIRGERAAAWTAQTYLDGWRRGVARTYWYLWTAEYYGFPGIQMRPGDPSTQALQTLGSWVVGARYEGCREQRGAVECRFSADGRPFLIAWATGERPVPFPALRGRTVCALIGGSCAPHSGQAELTELPIRID